MNQDSLFQDQSVTLPSLIAKIKVSEIDEGQRIDQFLSKLYPSYSRSRLSQWIKTGAITLNNSLCKPKEKVLAGNEIQINVEFPNSDTTPPVESEPIFLNIAYEDEYLLVINKPAGLVVHPGAGNHRNTLMNALLHYAPHLQHLPRAGIVHRLDKDTTGLLVVAKTLEVHLALVKQMQSHSVERHYLALVHGHLISGGTIHTHFGRHPQNRLKMAVCKHGHEAITHYTIQKHYKQFTLLDVKLFTGKTHQIRVHMAYKKHPLVGDPLYGGRNRLPREMTEELKDFLQDFKRQALHAYRLSFLHPVHQTELTTSAVLPADFHQLIQILDNSSFGN